MVGKAKVGGSVSRMSVPLVYVMEGINIVENEEYKVKFYV